MIQNTKTPTLFISPKTSNAVVFESTIASTKQGEFTLEGGATQTLVIDQKIQRHPLYLLLLLSKHPEFRAYKVGIKVYPDNAEVFINNKVFSSPEKLYRGQYALEVRLDGYKSIIGSFYVAGKDKKLSFELHKDSDGDGVIDVEDKCPNSNIKRLIERDGCALFPY